MDQDQCGDNLAINGGSPVRQRPWPTWPRADSGTERNVLDVLHSGRWAISGMYNGARLYERRFADAFAGFNRVAFCVPVSNGSAALTVALEALGVGYGAEVLVPGITWVACASSVAGIGAIPVFVDVEPDTLCMSVEAARQAITPRTAAIMLVHLYCTIADLDSFVKLSSETGIPLLEDCSQAHGAIWRNRHVGTFGKIGVFSMQDSKVLTCGEGGAAITNDPVLFDRMQRLRADGRRFTATPPPLGHQELEETGGLQGRNYCLSELHSAVLLDRLGYLNQENSARETNANYLRALLSDINGVSSLIISPGADRITYYQYCFEVESDEFGGRSPDWIRRALAAELQLFVEPADAPLNRNVLYTPLDSPRVNAEQLKRLDPTHWDLPVATRMAKRCFTISHRVLLGDEGDMEDIAAAFRKIQAHTKRARDVSDSAQEAMA